jgi:hypothetical protein
VNSDASVGSRRVDLPVERADAVCDVDQALVGVVHVPDPFNVDNETVVVASDLDARSGVSLGEIAHELGGGEVRGSLDQCRKALIGQVAEP